MKKRWDEDKPFLESVRDSVFKAIGKYFDAGDKAFRDKISWEELHGFRLESKRFRYTLELFEQFYGKPLQSRIKEVKVIQNDLGDINDLVTTRSLLKGHAAFRKDLRERAEKKMEKLRDHWVTVFAGEGRREAWLATADRPKLASRRRKR